jgi:hypothetical protein
MNVPSTLTLRSVIFRNFKALQNYSIGIERMNILVGANNAGKSTIVGAFRALSSALRSARAKSPTAVIGPNGLRFGYSISHDSLPISLENVHTDYTDSESSVVFRFSAGQQLHLYFPRSGACLLFAEHDGKVPKSSDAFRRMFPFTVGVVPVLGPVESDEPLLAVETVQRHLHTHRASRHFRNYWRQFPEGFDDFATLLSETWPGMEIRRPELDFAANRLSMFCLERRISRELYWARSGFQIWCQLLTHLLRARRDSILVIDEPEIYLHPELQRRLLTILRDIDPDAVLATHSAEIMSEAEPGELLVIDKARKSAERLKNVETVQVALGRIASIHNVTLSQLARSRRLLFVESLDDFKAIRRFARKLGFSDLAAGIGLSAVETEGFESWQKVKGFSWGLSKALGHALKVAAIFDRDFRCDEEVNAILEELKAQVAYAVIHECKEMENYLLVPAVLDRAIAHALDDRAKRGHAALGKIEGTATILTRLAARKKNAFQAQYTRARRQFLKPSRRDESTIDEETIDGFDAKWKALSSRLYVVDGKEILSALREEIQNRYSVTLTTTRIIDEFRVDEIPESLQTVVAGLEKFRTSS